MVVAGTTSGLNAGVRCDRFGPAKAGEARFGAALGAGRFGPDGIADVVVAMTSNYDGGVWRRGATRVFDGESTGHSATRVRYWLGL